MVQITIQKACYGLYQRTALPFFGNFSPDASGRGVFHTSVALFLCYGWILGFFLA